MPKNHKLVISISDPVFRVLSIVGRHVKATAKLAPALRVRKTVEGSLEAAVVGATGAAYQRAMSNPRDEVLYRELVDAGLAPDVLPPPSQEAPPRKRGAGSGRPAAGAGASMPPRGRSRRKATAARK